ncbi:MAG: TraB/GumN family protein [Gammaproteobacteria bacterium]
MKPRILLIVCLLALLAGPAPAATVYRCIDGKGHVSFQQLPCNGLAVSSPPATADAGHHMLWRLDGGSTTVYLLGSIHFGNADMYPLPAVISDAYAVADALVVEVNMAALDPTETAALISELGTYRDGGNLKEMLDAATWDRLEQVAHRLGIPSRILALQKPWFAAMTLAVVALQKSGYDERWGIDKHFMEQAAGSGKPILELETLMEQLGMMDRLSPRVQQAMLLQSLHEVERSGDYFGAMVAAWQQGDVAALEQLVAEGFSESPAGRRMYEVFLTQRNSRMADKIEALLGERRTYFVVVGAAHLVGQEGLVHLLQARGHRLSQL